MAMSSKEFADMLANRKGDPRAEAVLQQLNGGARPPAAVQGGKPIVLKSIESTLNKTELAWSARERFRMNAGEVRRFWMQSVKIQIAPRCWYTPDCLTEEASGLLVFTELKGFLRDDALVKFKDAQKLMPFARWQMVKRGKGGAWEVTYENEVRAPEPLAWSVGEKKQRRIFMTLIEAESKADAIERKGKERPNVIPLYPRA